MKETSCKIQFMIKTYDFESILISFLCTYFDYEVTK